MLYRLANLRPAIADDRSCIVPIWLNSHSNSKYAKARGSVPDYWNIHEPRLHKWLDTAEAVVICDKEAPEIVWAFAVFANPSTIHYAVVKLQFKEYAAECFEWMFGSRLQDAQNVTHELCDLKRHKFHIPRGWDIDPYWAAA